MGRTPLDRVYKGETDIMISRCPIDNCEMDEKDINLQKNPDAQCAYNHAGVLCGRCQKGYSLAIGSSHCIHCPNNNNLALLIFFAAAGFFLVIAISVSNLTVTQGMINGLMFYGIHRKKKQGIVTSSNSTCLWWL